MLRIARELVDRGFLEEAAKYVQENQARLVANEEFPKLAVWIGGEFVSQGDHLTGLSFYEMALRLESDDLVVLNNVAWQLATNPDPRVRNGARAVRWSLRAAELTQHQNPNVLATLAVSYAEAGQFEKALETSATAAQFAKQQGNSALHDSLLQRMQLFKSGRPFHRQ